MNIVPWIRFCSFEARHLKLAFLSVKYGSVSDVPDVVIFSCSGVEVVDIVAEDLYSNIADISIEVSVTIQPSGPVPKDVVLPALENKPVRIALSHGMARLPRLTLCSRVGNHIGDYLLVFSAPGVQSQSVKFAFSTGRFFFVLFRWKEFNLRNANQFVEAYATFSFVRPRWGNVQWTPCYFELAAKSLTLFLSNSNGCDDGNDNDDDNDNSLVNYDCNDNENNVNSNFNGGNIGFDSNNGGIFIWV